MPELVTSLRESKLFGQIEWFFPLSSKKNHHVHIVCTFSYSPIIYGNQVETYGPYPQDYTRDYHLLYLHLNNQISILSTNNRTITNQLLSIVRF